MPSAPPFQNRFFTVGIEDANGQGWLVLMDVNVDAVAKEKRLPQALKDRINEVRQSLVEIMQAGAKGEL